MADDVVPSSTFVVDNPGAGTGSDAPANSFTICDLSGFRALPRELVETWNGLKVLPEYFEERNMQDFVKAIPERLEGSTRPEQDDVFLAVGEVSVGDL